MLADTDVNPITERIIGCAFAVSRILRPGFSERVFANALAIKMGQAGLSFQRHVPVSVFFEGQNVGDYVADMLVEHRVLVELKAVRALNESHVAQCLNYLAATGISVCLLLNFGTPRVEVRRVFLQAPVGVKITRTGSDNPD
jgi:GxxExxY protein